MIVVDTNILVYFYISTEMSKLAEDAFLKDPYWISPLLWRSEFRNVLALYLRKNILSLEEIVVLMQEVENFMARKEYSVSSDEVLKLVASSQCSAYDCEFVALARNQGIKLITEDKKLLSTFPETAMTLEYFVTSDM